MLEHLFPIILGQDTILIFIDAIDNPTAAKFITGDILRRKINEAEESVTSPNLQKQPYRNINQPFRNSLYTIILIRHLL